MTTDDHPESLRMDGILALLAAGDTAAADALAALDVEDLDGLLDGAEPDEPFVRGGSEKGT